MEHTYWRTYQLDLCTGWARAPAGSPAGWLPRRVAATEARRKKGALGGRRDARGATDALRSSLARVTNCVRRPVCALTHDNTCSVLRVDVRARVLMSS